jgi:flagellar motility protein MotE (MotC chaperone)
MIAKLMSPLVFAVVGVLASVALGVSMTYRVIVPALQARVVEHKAEDPEKKARDWNFWTIEIENLSTELKEQKALLQKRTDTLDQREARIALQEKELAKVRDEIEKLRRDIGVKVTEISADETKQLRTLSQTYAGMTPKAVVVIFREMDDVTVTKILSLMKPEIVSAIFEEMSRTAGADGSPAGKRAAVLSEKLRLMKAAKTASR